MKAAENEAIPCEHRLAAMLDESDLSSLGHPDWEAGFDCWEFYVPAEIQECWPRLSTQSRLAVAVVCAEIASDSLARLE